MREITQILSALAHKRPIFHSEADFQHALACEIERQMPNARVRCGMPIPLSNRRNRIFIDIYASYEGAILAIELKYTTRGLVVPIGDEWYELKNRAAQDLHRYDFMEDIERLEQLISEYPDKNITGYAILLTNDSALWEPPSKSLNPVDADFRLYEGREVHGILQWGAHASEGTKKNRERAIRLRGKYRLQWTDYSQIGPGHQFRVLVVKVTPEALAGSSG